MKARIKAIAETRVRYGYRRITVLFKREGWAVNGKRIHRVVATFSGSKLDRAAYPNRASTFPAIGLGTPRRVHVAAIGLITGGTTNMRLIGRARFSDITVESR